MAQLTIIEQIGQGQALNGLTVGQLRKYINESNQTLSLASSSLITIKNSPVYLAPGDQIELYWNGHKYVEIDRTQADIAEDIKVEDFGAVGDGVTDDAAAFQAAINASLTQHLPVRLAAKTYLINTEIQFPDGAVTILGAPFLVGTSNGTNLKAGASIRSIFNLERTGSSSIRVTLSDIGFDGARLATYCMRLVGCAFSTFINIAVGGSLQDGVRVVNYNASNNDQNTWQRFSSGGCGSLYLSSQLLVDENGLYGILSPVCINTAGTCATSNGSNTVTFTGAPNLTTLGPAVGDSVRVGTGANKRFGVITAVTDATHLSVQFDTSDGLCDVTASGQYFALARGDGYYEERSGDNNLACFTGGGASHRANAGFALSFDGLYGPRVEGAMSCDFHHTWFIRVGKVGGQPVITSKFDGMYFESSGTGKNWLLRSCNLIDIRTALDSGGADTANISYCGARANVSGRLITQTGEYSLGSSAYKSYTPSLVVGGTFGTGADYYGPVKFALGTSAVSGGQVTRGPGSLAASALALIDSTGDPTVSDIAVFGSELLILGISGGGTVTLQASSTLHLTTSTYAMTAANGNTITLVYINGAWHEISRAKADKTS